MSVRPAPVPLGLSAILWSIYWAARLAKTAAVRVAHLPRRQVILPTCHCRDSGLVSLFRAMACARGSS